MIWELSATKWHMRSPFYRCSRGRPGARISVEEGGGVTALLARSALDRVMGWRCRRVEADHAVEGSFVLGRAFLLFMGLSLVLSMD